VQLCGAAVGCHKVQHITHFAVALKLVLVNMHLLRILNRITTATAAAAAAAAPAATALICYRLQTLLMGLKQD